MKQADVWAQLCVVLVAEIGRLREVIEQSGMPLPYPPAEVIERLRNLHEVDKSVAAMIEGLVDT